MREKLFLLASIAFLVGSADHALFVTPSVAQITPPATTEETFTAAPIRRVLVEMQKEKEVMPEKTAPVHRTHYRQRTTPIRKPQRQVIQIPQEVQKSFAPEHTFDPIHPAIDRPEIHIKHRVLADDVIKLMPQKCHSTLRNFYVKYEGMEGRGLGGKSTIILNGNVPDDEFRALFVHEFGHVFDLGCITGSTFAANSHFRDGSHIMKVDDPSVDFYQISWLSDNVQKAGSTSEDFVSGYASWDMFEDFAESFSYYVLHRAEFAKRAKENSALAAKYHWFQLHLPNFPTIAISNHQWNGHIPWDTTKLSYTWIGNAEVAHETNR